MIAILNGYTKDIPKKKVLFSKSVKLKNNKVKAKKKKKLGIK